MGYYDRTSLRSNL